VETLDRVSRDGILALGRLTMLETLVYKNDMPDHLIRHCLELLQHLHYMHYPTLSMSTIEVPCTLQLRYLALVNINNISEQVSLPGLETFHLMEPLEMHPLFAGGLPKLSELHLLQTDKETLLLVLGHVGRQLRSLQFYISSDWVQLDRVLTLCPDLSELHVKSFPNQGLRVSQLLPDTLKKLESVTLGLLQFDDYLQKGLLLQILRLAPELSSLSVSGYLFYDEDLKEWAELAEKGTCMQNLQQLRIQLDAEHQTENGKRLLDNAITSCCINCSQLRTASVNY
jgi:hypothetical protein